MLSHVVMRVVQVFPSFVMLSLACVFVRGDLPSVEMWLVMLESAKDRVLGVDTTGIHVPPRVRYEMAC
jgi:hypothetical protein